MPRRRLSLAYATLGSTVAGVAIVALAAIVARSVALSGLALDSLVEIVASVGVVWQRADAHPGRDGET